MRRPDSTTYLLCSAAAVVLLSGALSMADAQEQAPAPIIPPAQQAQPVISGAISVDEAVDIALKNSPTVEARQAMVAAAAARVGAAKAMTRPQVSGAGRATTATTPMIVPGPASVEPRTWNIAPDESRLHAMVMAMYPLYTGGKLQAQVSNTGSLRQAAAGDLAASELDASLAAKTTYYQVLLARELVDVYQRRVSEAQERLRIAEEAYKEGRIAKYDLLRNRTDLAESQQQLNDAQRDVEVALADLKNALGVSQESDLTLTDSLGVPELMEQLAALQQLAVQQRPEVAAAQARIQAAQAGVKVAKSAYKPQVYATGMAEAGAGAGAGDSDSGALIGVTAAIPIFDGGLRRSAVNEAQAAVRQAQAGKRDVLLAVNRDVSASYARADAAARNVDLAKAAVDQAEEDYRIIKLRYEAGKAINVEVLDALAALTRARADYVAALYNYNVARADLLRATGRG